MTIGAQYWVWYDDEPKSTVMSKIDNALKRYQEKFGELPRECKFNEKMVVVPEEVLAGERGFEIIQIPGVQVLTYDNIPSNNFWLGPIPQLLTKK